MVLASEVEKWAQEGVEFRNLQPENQLFLLNLELSQLFGANIREFFAINEAPANTRLRDLIISAHIIAGEYVAGDHQFDHLFVDFFSLPADTGNYVADRAALLFLPFKDEFMDYADRIGQAEPGDAKEAISNKRQLTLATHVVAKWLGFPEADLPLSEKLVLADRLHTKASDMLTQNSDARPVWLSAVAECINAYGVQQIRQTDGGDTFIQRGVDIALRLRPDAAGVAGLELIVKSGLVEEVGQALKDEKTLQAMETGVNTAIDYVNGTYHKKSAVKIILGFIDLLWYLPQTESARLMAVRTMVRGQRLLPVDDTDLMPKNGEELWKRWYARVDQLVGGAGLPLESQDLYEFVRLSETMHDPYTRHPMQEIFDTTGIKVMRKLVSRVSPEVMDDFITKVMSRHEFGWHQTLSVYSLSGLMQMTETTSHHSIWRKQQEDGAPIAMQVLKEATRNGYISRVKKEIMQLYYADTDTLTVDLLQTFGRRDAFRVWDALGFEQVNQFDRAFYGATVRYLQAYEPVKTKLLAGEKISAKDRDALLFAMTQEKEAFQSVESTQQAIANSWARDIFLSEQVAVKVKAPIAEYFGTAFMKPEELSQALRLLSTDVAARAPFIQWELFHLINLKDNRTALIQAWNSDEIVTLEGKASLLSKLLEMRRETSFDEETGQLLTRWFERVQGLKANQVTPEELEKRWGTEWTKPLIPVFDTAGYWENRLFANSESRGGITEPVLKKIKNLYFS